MIGWVKFEKITSPVVVCKCGKKPKQVYVKLLITIPIHNYEGRLENEPSTKILEVCCKDCFEHKEV